MVTQYKNTRIIENIISVEEQLPNLINLIQQHPFLTTGLVRLNIVNDIDFALKTRTRTADSLYLVGCKEGVSEIESGSDISYLAPNKFELGGFVSYDTCDLLGNVAIGNGCTTINDSTEDQLIDTARQTVYQSVHNTLMQLASMALVGQTTLRRGQQGQTETLVANGHLVSLPVVSAPWSNSTTDIIKIYNDEFLAPILGAYPEQALLANHNTIISPKAKLYIDSNDILRGSNFVNPFVSVQQQSNQFVNAVMGNLFVMGQGTRDSAGVFTPFIAEDVMYGWAGGEPVLDIYLAPTQDPRYTNSQSVGLESPVSSVARTLMASNDSRIAGVQTMESRNREKLYFELGVKFQCAVVENVNSKVFTQEVF